MIAVIQGRTNVRLGRSHRLLIMILEKYMNNNLIEDFDHKIRKYLNSLKLPDRECEHVFHYCSLEAGLGILKSECLWMSHHRYMNDPSEIGYSMDLIQGCVRSNLNGDVRDNVLYFLENQIAENYHCLITSFLEKEDYMPGWRYYAENGKGVAMKFKKTVFIQTTFPEIITTGSVIYDTLQRDIINKILSIFLTYSPENQKLLQPELVNQLIVLMPYFKVNDYQDEWEWRACSIRLFNPILKIYLPSPPPDLLLIDSQSKPIYQILNFSLDDLAGITFGPCCDGVYSENQFRKIFLQKGVSEERIRNFNFGVSTRRYRS